MASKSKYYCIQCLRKVHRRFIPQDGNCPECLIPLRSSTSRIVAQIVTRLRRHRGLAEIPKRGRGDYQTYLESDLWKSIRERVISRDNETCQMCGNKADIVHHKSYDREVLDGHRDSDLVSLCFGCHSSIEFNEENGKMVKNDLAEANRKLVAATPRIRKNVGCV